MKRIVLVLLCICILLSVVPMGAAESVRERPPARGNYPVPDFRAQPIWEKIDRGIPLVISHKADWRNFPEVSILAVDSCIKMGVDMIEVDFHVTKDGVPVALHDDNLRRMTSADTLIYIHEITWNEAKKYPLEDGMGHKGTNYILTEADAKVLNSLSTYVSNVGTAKAGGTMPISRFDSILELVNKQAFLLMDKITTAESFAYAYVCAKEWDMLDYVVFKGNYTLAQLEPWFTAGAELWNQKYPAAPVTAQEVKTSIVFEYNNTNPNNVQALLNGGVRVLGLAAGVNDSNEARIRNTLAPYCRKNGIYLRCNTGDTSYMGANAKVDCEIGWAELFEIGYTGVMTDRPGPLTNYVQERYRIRPASDRIDAEHFSNYNQDDFGFTVPEDWNAGRNKVVSNLTSTDTLIYEEIEFDGTENIFTAKAAASNSAVHVYLDGTEAANKVASLEFDSTSYTSKQVEIAPVLPGKHTVYLKFSGTVALDQFRFTRGLYFGFSNERLARFRYQDCLYGSLNFDTGNWFTRPSYMSAATLDNTAGTMSVTLTNGGNHYIQTGNVVGDRPLHYIPQQGDYFQMRLKISNVTAHDPSAPMTMGLVYSTADNSDFSYANRVVQTVTQAQLNGEYFTLTMAMNSAFVNASEITAIRLYFTNLAPIGTKTAKITVDQVYIGPKAYLPQKEYLYFDYTDRDTDEMRYRTSLYGYQNFDKCPWFVRTTTMRGAWYDPLASTLLARVTTGGNHYIQTGSALKDRPLHYTPSETDYLQMRLRIDHGKAHDASLPLSFGIAYASADRTDFYYNARLRKEYDPSVIDSGYFTVTIPMPSFFIAETEIQSLRIYISNLAPAGEEAVIEVDSFYIGPKESLPEHVHTEVIDEAVAPTCTETGLSEGTHCSECNAVIVGQTTVPATGHTEVIDQAVAPTCTETGLSEGTHCSVCGDVLIAQKIIDAFGHRYEAVVTVPTCEAAGFTTYTCLCGQTYVDDNVAATGHTYSYTDKGEKHMRTCKNCGDSAEEDHAFADGICICGAVESTEPILDVGLKFHMSISAGAEMVVNYNFMANVVDKYDAFYLEVSKHVAGALPSVTVYELDDFDIINHPISGESMMYLATYRGINAKEMGDDFTTTLYAVDADGRVHYGPTQIGSIKSYLLEKMDGASAEFKTMAIDMLKYGAAAQICLKYDTGNLVTADLTEAQLRYATPAIPEAIDCSTVSGSGVNISTGVTVATKVELNLSCIYTAAKDPSTVKCIITDAQGEVLAVLETSNYGGIMYSAKYDNVGAKQMREPITATFHADGKEISKTLTWNIESYVAQTRLNESDVPDKVNMVNAMLVYGDSVAAYLSSLDQ